MRIVVELDVTSVQGEPHHVGIVAREVEMAVKKAVENADFTVLETRSVEVYL